MLFHEIFLGVSGKNEKSLFSQNIKNLEKYALIMESADEKILLNNKDILHKH